MKDEGLANMSVTSVGRGEPLEGGRTRLNKLTESEKEKDGRICVGTLITEVRKQEKL